MLFRKKKDSEVDVSSLNEISYNEQKNLDYILKDYEVIGKEYKENIFYIVLIPKDKLFILNNYKYKIENEEYIKVPSKN